MMFNFNDKTRDLHEEIFLKLLFTNPKFIERLRVKYFYLHNEELKSIFKDFCVSYHTYKVVGLASLLSINPNFNIDLYVHLISNVFEVKHFEEDYFNFVQEKILEYYKKDVIKNLNIELETNKIDYLQFNQKIKEIEQITITGTNENRMLTISDINSTEEEPSIYVKSNTKELDKVIKGFILGELSVWSGGNASAKSTYLNQLAIESIAQDYKVAIFSGELTSKRLIKWITMQCAGKKNISYNKEKEYYFVNSFAKEKILKWLNNKLYIYDNNYGNKANEILESVRKCIDTNGTKVIILDNLMSMNLSSYGDQKYDTQTKLITDLSALAKEKGVHIHFVCHPRKANTFLRKNDISGTADLTNIADNVIIMHRVNKDFIRNTKEMFQWTQDSPIYEFSNVIEVCKNREFGVQDYFVGMYFETESKRLLNERGEVKKYGWEYLQ